MTTTTTEFGRYEHGKIEGRWRRDVYIPHARPEERIQDRIMAADHRDESQVYTGQYDAKCSCCWLGIGHTERAHVESAAR